MGASRPAGEFARRSPLHQSGESLTDQFVDSASLLLAG